MLKKLDKFNKKLTKVLIVLNILMIVFDLLGIFISPDFEHRLSFLKYMGLHSIMLFFFMWVSKNDNKEKE